MSLFDMPPIAHHLLFALYSCFSPLYIRAFCPTSTNQFRRARKDGKGEKSILSNIGHDGSMTDTLMLRVLQLWIEDDSTGARNIPKEGPFGMIC